MSKSKRLARARDSLNGMTRENRLLLLWTKFSIVQEETFPLR